MIKKIELAPGRYFLHRQSDKAGDSGMYFVAIRPDGTHEANILEIGSCVRVGSHYARSYSMQDYWTTTPVTEIISVSDNIITFKTRNNVYKLQWDA